MPEPLLQAENLEKTYRSAIPFIGRDVEVLTGASMTVEPGEVVGIVGENGSGKSTLMQILTGALQQDAGRVERSCRLGWCPQEVLLYERLTVRETFRLFGEAYGLETETITASMHDLADRLGFEEYLDRRIDRLSGGNRQKVNLSVALLHEPELLLLDEPYSGFDWHTYQMFWEMVDDFVDNSRSLVIISHFVNERKRFDRILHLQDGTLEEG